MSKHIIITIGRLNGSGGREIGETLARELGISFYDKQLIQLAAQKCGIQEDIAMESEETATNSLLYSLSMGGSLWSGRSMLESELPITDRLFIAQSGIIKNISGNESCVIVGRCADDVLRSDINCINVFVHADVKFRLNRVEGLKDLSDDRALKELKRMDKKRGSYYNYFTDKKWGDMENYTICASSSQLGIRGVVDMIKSVYEKKTQELAKTK